MYRIKIFEFGVSNTTISDIEKTINGWLENLQGIESLEIATLSGNRIIIYYKIKNITVSQ